MRWRNDIKGGACRGGANWKQWSAPITVILFYLKEILVFSCGTQCNYCGYPCGSSCTCPGWSQCTYSYYGSYSYTMVSQPLPVLALILTGVCQICPTQNVRNNQIWTLNSADLKYMYVHNAYKPSLVIIVRREMGNGTPRHVGHQCPTGWNEEWYNCLASLVMILLYILCGSFPSVADCNYFGPTMPERRSLPPYSRFLHK